MFKRPTSRRKSSKKQIELNLVPILDTIVTLIAFLLFTTSFLTLVHIESPAPMASTKEVQEKLKEKPLQLTVSLREKDAEIWSPFEKIKPKTIPNVLPNQPDVKAIHEALVGVKQQFPTETKVVIVPSGGMTYDTLIAAMDAMRMMDPASDPMMTQKNPATGVDEAIKQLFPEVVFGNLLSGG